MWALGFACSAHVGALTSSCRKRVHPKHKGSAGAPDTLWRCRCGSVGLSLWGLGRLLSPRLPGCCCRVGPTWRSRAPHPQGMPCNQSSHPLPSSPAPCCRAQQSLRVGGARVSRTLVCGAFPHLSCQLTPALKWCFQILKIVQV